jgi:hypothetical protein
MQKSLSEKPPAEISPFLFLLLFIIVHSHGGIYLFVKKLRYDVCWNDPGFIQKISPLVTSQNCDIKLAKVSSCPDSLQIAAGSFGRCANWHVLDHCDYSCFVLDMKLFLRILFYKL